MLGKQTVVEHLNPQAVAGSFVYFVQKESGGTVISLAGNVLPQVLLAHAAKNMLIVNPRFLRDRFPFRSSALAVHCLKHDLSSRVYSRW